MKLYVCLGCLNVLQKQGLHFSAKILSLRPLKDKAICFIVWPDGEIGRRTTLRW